MFKVLNPYYLFLLALPVLMALLYLRHRTTGARRLGEIVDPGLVPVIAPDHRPRRAHIAAALTVCAAVLMIGAAAWPMIGTGTKLARASGVDVVVAVDVSKSMSSRDVTPSRLERAKIELGEFIKRLHGDRVGVVVFAGEAFTQCPLTTDYEAAMLFIRSIDRNSVPQPGTSLKKAIATAREM
ncbi:MAG: VWA domain-containing protein, partial [Myxococcota bacterium]